MADTIALHNPRTGEREGHIPIPGSAEIASRAQSLRAAQPAWRKAGPEARCRALHDWREALLAQRQAITEALAADTGRRLLAALEVTLIEQRIARWCELAPRLLAEPPEARSQAVESVRCRQQQVPYPLVGVISPWNFPLLLALMDPIPALLAGCSVLVKPSEVTPRFIAPLRESVAAVPSLAKVLDIIPGDAGSGAALVQEADAICFTGSEATGRRVAVAAAQRLIPAFLELGGKDPAIVLASADLENAARAIMRSAAGGTGQGCQSLERIYVDARVMEEFMAILVREAQTIRLSYPDAGSGHIGPFIDPRQAEVVQRQLEDATAQGARIHYGGRIETHGGGRWCLPTVLSGISHDMLLMQEETFGPLLPVMSFRDAEEAIALANDSKYGLSAAVFAGTEEEALAIARRIDAGAISINDAGLTTLVDDADKDSFAASGLGRSRMGETGLTRFLRRKALLIQEQPAKGLGSLAEGGERD